MSKCHSCLAWDNRTIVGFNQGLKWQRVGNLKFSGPKYLKMSIIIALVMPALPSLGLGIDR